MDALPALDTVYPDARFVVTHRDVASVIPSMAALLCFINGMCTVDLDKKYIGQQTEKRWKSALDALMSFRDNQGSMRFFDVSFRRAQSDSVAVMREMYAWLGEPFTPDFQKRMAAWQAERPKNKHGAVKIDSADYGLSAEQLRQTFARYLERYQSYLAE
jgi:hypothetical protein